MIIVTGLKLKKEEKDGYRFRYWAEEHQEKIGRFYRRTCEKIDSYNQKIRERTWDKETKEIITRLSEILK